MGDKRLSGEENEIGKPSLTISPDNLHPLCTNVLEKSMNAPRPSNGLTAGQLEPFSFVKGNLFFGCSMLGVIHCCWNHEVSKPPLPSEIL